jgi:hypothetical protein
MPACTFHGDRIVVDTAHFRLKRAAVAKVGINSHEWNKLRLADVSCAGTKTGTTAISLGTNSAGIDTRVESRRLIATILSRRVGWLMPTLHPTAQRAVWALAREYGDLVLTPKALGGDNANPTASESVRLSDATR